MAHVIAVPSSDIRAEYDVIARELKLNAKGVLFERVSEPFFQQERWAGGLRFSLVAFSDSDAVAEGNNIVEFPFEAKTFVLKINLPLPHFNNKLVLVDTASELAKVEIHYLGWPTRVPIRDGAAAQANENLGTSTSDVLTPKRVGLVGGQTLQITAQIPKTTGDAKAWVDVSYNNKFIKIDDANVAAGPDSSVTWTIQWAEFPTGKNNPQLLEVITKQWNGIVGPDSRWSKIIQGYIITGLVLNE